MSIGLLGSLLRLPVRKRRPWQFTKPAGSCRRLFLEGLETRALPSILIATSGLADLVAPVVPGVASSAGPTNGLDDPLGQEQPGEVGGQSYGQQGVQIGTGSTQVVVGVVTQLKVVLGQLSIQPIVIVHSNPQGDNGTSSQGNGQTGVPGDGQGDQQLSQGVGQSNPGDSSDNGQADTQGDSPQVSQGDGQSGQGDGSENGPLGGPGSGTNTPVDVHEGRHHCQHTWTNSGSSDGQGDNQKLQSDTGQDGTMNNGPATALGGKTSTGPADAQGDNTNNGSATLSTGDGTNGQGSAPDRKQHGPSSVAVSEGEQSGPSSAPDGKQHGPDGALVSSEEPHNLVSLGSQEPEQNYRNQAGVIAHHQNGAMEDLGQRQDQARGPLAEALQHSAIAEAPYTPTEEVLAPVGNDVSEDTIDHPNVSPQNHGLLTNNLSLEFSSLRSEVQKFFAQIDNLGAHPTDRQIGMILCSGAVVVAAAMACEVARRQARRPASDLTFALIPRLGSGNEADAPSGIGLPNFGQFSALS